MTSLRWHSILPSGAFDSSFLEDLTPALEQSNYFGGNGLLLMPEGCKASYFPLVLDKVFQRNLIPHRYVTLDEFSLSDEITEQLHQKFHFAVVIDREPTAAAVERMLATRSSLEQLSYVIIGRKDWRFKDTFRAIPHFIRPRLFLDFPISLHCSDPFYKSAELAGVLHELKRSGGSADIRSFDPHIHLRRELLRANVIAVSTPSKPTGPMPELSIVCPDPDLTNRLLSLEVVQKYGARVEIVVPRVIGGGGKSIQPSRGPALSPVWLHLEESVRHFPEIRAHLRNWGARHSRGNAVLFADDETPGRLGAILERFFLEGGPSEAILKSGLGILVEPARFQAVGGFDPLYAYFGLEEHEFLHRYLGGLRLGAEDGELAQYLRPQSRTSLREVGLELFCHQHFDFSFFKYFSSIPAKTAQPGGEAAGGAETRNQFRYRMEQSRDAYLSLYKASPKVALYGNIQLLLRPYHWVKPHAWRLKIPVHWVKRHAWRLRAPVAVPYHFIRRHAWRLKMPVYRLIIRAYHWVKRHAWRLRAPVAVPYHFIRKHAWRPKIFFHFIKGNLWRWKRIYYFFFWLLFPVRKIFYFFEYQYEKRLLGLYGKQHLWIQK